MSRERTMRTSTSEVRTSWPVFQAITLGFLYLFATFLVSMWVTISFPRGNLPLRDFLAFEALVECVAIVGTAYLFIRIIWKHRDFWESIQWRPNNSMIVLSAMGGLFSSVLMHYVLTKRLAIGPISSSARSIFAITLATIVLQPLIEEIYFRGILFEALSFKIGPIWSISITTILFVLMHIGHHWNVLPIAIVLAVVRIKTRSTANCFALHAAYNLGMVIWQLSSITAS